MTEASTHPAPAPGALATASPVRVSVVVPHYEDLDSLQTCLAALERQTVDRDAFEIIVADNASPCGPAAVERAIAGSARLVVVTERGAGAARNGGVAHAKGDILAFTDCDCRPEPQWLSEGLKSLAEHDFVGGRMEVLVDDPAHMSAAEAFETVFAFHNETYVRKRGFTVTANLFCRREMFDKVGGFLSGVSEDWEWCLRAGAMGFRIGYAADAGVGHPARRTWPDLLKKWRRINAETYGLMMMSPPWGRVKWLARALGSPILALAGTPAALFSPKLRGPRQRLAAVATLYRLRWERLWDSLRLALLARPVRASKQGS
jgi:glycosyltransferase involved in cell wall biosynthesis